MENPVTDCFSKIKRFAGSRIPLSDELHETGDEIPILQAEKKIYLCKKNAPMKDILIIEDEIPARQQLVRLIASHYPDFRIAGLLDSVAGADAWLEARRDNPPFLIFMDVELSDGTCFELFRTRDISSPVIITTAYEDYALNAFKSKCIDYILKPIDDEAFRSSVDRCLSLYDDKAPARDLLHDLERIIQPPKACRQRFTIKAGNQILVINTHDIAFFHSENKSTYIFTLDGKQYLSDLSLDTIEEEVDPAVFFKLSRGCLAGLHSIRSISKYFNGRLKVCLDPPVIDPILVSRARVQHFLEWLEGKK